MYHRFLPEKNDGSFKDTAEAAPEEKFVCAAYDGRENYFHTHNRLQIGICHGGSGTVRVKDGTYDFARNTVLVVPGGSPHSIGGEGESEWKFLLMDAGAVIAAAGAPDRDTQEKMTAEFAHNACFDCGPEGRTVFRLISAIENELARKGYMYRESVRNLCWELLIVTARLKRSSLGMPEDVYYMRGSRQIRPALEYMRSRYAESLKIKEIADACHLSESHFRRLFRGQIGMSPMEYLNLVRIREACRQIREDRFTIEEIAERVGYGDMSTFYRNFRKITEKSPFQWKEAEFGSFKMP